MVITKILKVRRYEINETRVYSVGVAETMYQTGAHICIVRQLFRREPEGRYRCTKSMAIAPFWFSTEHL